MTTSISLTTADANGKTTTRSYAAVNGALTNSQMKTAIISLNGLTGNDFISATRVIKIDLDDEYTPPTEVTTNG